MNLDRSDIRALTLATYASYNSSMTRNHGCVVTGGDYISTGFNQMSETAVNGYSIHAEEQALLQPYFKLREYEEGSLRCSDC